MTEIESPLGKSSFAGRQNKVLTVEDHSGPQQVQPPQQMQQVHPAYQRRQPPPQQFQEQVEHLTRPLTAAEIEELKQKRAQAQQAKTRVSATARERIEYLTNIGRITDKFELDGVTFHMRSLKTVELEEVHDAMVALGDATQTKFNLEVRKHVLARSLYAIDDMPVGDIIGSDTLEDRLGLILNLDENLVDYMNKFYEENIMKVGRDKYGVNSQADMEELAKDVKKS